MPTIETTSTLVPTFSKIVVHRDEAQKMVGSLIIPEGHQRKPHTGTILAVGPDLPATSLFRVGTRVLFAEYSGTELKVNDESHIVMEASEVIAILQE